MKSERCTRKCCSRRYVTFRVCIMLLVAFILTAWITRKDVAIVPHSMRTTTEGHKQNFMIYASKSLHPNFNYVLEDATLCSSIPDLKLMVLVHSAPLNKDRRQAIRSTWTNNSYFPDLGPIKVLFVLGQVTNTSLQASLQNEFRHYGDILQGDFVDAYKNLTYKAIFGYKWLTERCRNAKVILKVDDDIMINTYKFVKDFLPQFLKTPRQIACGRLHNSVIRRNKKAKWYVDSAMFKGQKQYPDFCQGFTVVISNDVIPELYNASLTTEFFWIDDVFMYGLVSRKVKAITFNSLKHRSDVIWGADKPMKCYKARKSDCKYLAIMPWSNIPQNIRNLWSEVVNLYQEQKLNQLN